MEPTKGPYEVDKKGRSIRKNGKPIAFTAIPYTVDETRRDGESWLDMRRRTDPERAACDAEQKANAHLLAAAWDMREALRVIRHEWAGHSEHCAKHGDAAHRKDGAKCDCDWPKVAAQCDAALRKAEGKTDV